MALAYMRGLALISPVSDMEIAQELLNRNYTTGQTPTTTPTTTISRADAIKAGVNKALDQRSMERSASRLTYVEVWQMSYLVQDAKNYANSYLDGSQVPGGSILSGMRRGIGMGILSSKSLSNIKTYGTIWQPSGTTDVWATIRNQYAATGTAPAPSAIPPASESTTSSGWWILLNMIGYGVIQWSNYQLYKDTMQQKGYNVNPLSTNQALDYQYRTGAYLTPEQMKAMGLTQDDKTPTTPTWVWVAAGIAGAYVLMQITQRRPA